MEFFFDSREDASVAAAARIVASLSRRLEQQDAVSLVVSGGSTPVRCFEALAETPIAWDRITVLLSDERWVPPSDPDSNEKMVRDNLLTGAAGRASLVPVYAAGDSPAARCDTLQEQIRHLPFPFACSLLGMGTDGHFASLFPDAENLAEGLDPESDRLWLPVSTAASPHARITMSLGALSRSDDIVLLLFGDDKMKTYNAAMSADSTLPVARLLRQKRARLGVYWAP